MQVDTLIGSLKFDLTLENGYVPKALLEAHGALSTYQEAGQTGCSLEK